MPFWKQRRLNLFEKESDIDKDKARIQFWKRNRDSAMASTRGKTSKKEEEETDSSLVSLTKAIEALSKQVISVDRNVVALSADVKTNSQDIKANSRELKINSQEIKACKLELESTKQEIKSYKEELNKKFDEWKEESSARFNQIEETVNKNSKDICELQDLSAEIIKDVDTLNTWTIAADDKLQVLEAQGKNRNLRFRKIPEQFGLTNLKSEFVKEIEKFIVPDQPVLIENIFRVNSRLARERNWDRDIFVTFDSKIIRDQILARQRSTPLTIQGKKILIFQDLPRDTLRRRGEFNFLRNILLQKNIRYRWKVPFALEVIFAGGNQIIKTIDEARALAHQLSTQPNPATVPPAPLQTPTSANQPGPAAPSGSPKT